MAIFKTTPRIDSCDDRRRKTLEILPDAKRLGHYARDIYDNSHIDEMVTQNLSSLDLGGGKRAYLSDVGRHYAEVHIEPSSNKVVVVFVGTRQSIGADVYTDVINHLGFDTGYYHWAADLVTAVKHAHSGKSFTVTGHSLGGGLAIYAVLKNPEVNAFVFNSAGLSEATWDATSSSDRARVNGAITAIATRNADEIDPVTALSLTGHSILPGRIVILDTDVEGREALHSLDALLDALDRRQLTAAPAEVDCDDYLGVVAKP